LLLELTTTTSCSSGELLVNVIVSLPGVALIWLSVNLSCPVGFRVDRYGAGRRGWRARLGLVVFVVAGRVDVGNVPVAPSR